MAGEHGEDGKWEVREREREREGGKVQVVVCSWLRSAAETSKAVLSALGRDG